MILSVGLSQAYEYFYVIMFECTFDLTPPQSVEACRLSTLRYTVKRPEWHRACCILGIGRHSSRSCNAVVHCEAWIYGVYTARAYRLDIV